MGRKKSKTKQKQLGISSGPDTTSKQPPHGSSQEDEPSRISSSKQPQVACSIKHGGERDDSVFPHEDETKFPRLTKAENTLQHWQSEIDNLSVPEIILQLKSDSPKTPEGRHEDLSTESAPKVFPSRSNQRKVAEHQKNVQGSIKITQVREYWNALGNEKKRSVLEVSIHDLRVHHASRRHKLAVELLTEALSFAKTNKTWAFWDCFRCGEIFTDQESHRKHVWLHIGNLPPESLPLYPEEVDHRWAELIVNGCWKPFDLLAVVAILRGRRFSHVAILRGRRFSQSSTGIGSSDVGIHLEGSNNDRFSEKSVQAVHVDLEAGIVHNEGGVEGGHGSGNSSSDVLVDDERQDDADPIYKGWPLSDDPERSELLEKIRAGFLSLLRLRCLGQDHMDLFITLAINFLRKLAPGFEPRDYGLDETHACICLLDARRLRVMLWFFEKLNHLAVDFKSTTDEDYTCSVDAPVSDVISLSDDLSHLILNKFLSTVDTVSTAENAIQGECSTAPVHPKDGVVDREDFVSWIYSSSSSGEELKSWIRWKEIKRSQGEEVFENLKKFFNEIQSLLKERWDNRCELSVLNSIRLYCLNQSSQRYSDTENIPPSLEAILRKLQEELADGDGSIEREIVAIILKEAQRSDGTQIVHGNTSHSSDSIPSLDADSFTEYSLHRANKNIISGFVRQDMKFFYGLTVIDVKIRQRVIAMQQLKCKLAVISAFDYLEIVFFLVKTFLKEHLEALVHKEAEMKSDASLEGLVAGLELEEKKNIKTKKKRNKRKKKKDQNRAKDPKDTGDKSVPAYQENAEQA